MTSLTRQCAWLSWMLAGCIALVLMQTKALAQSLEVCRSGKPVAYVILPEMQGPTRNIVAHTLNGYLQRSYNWQLPVAQELTQAGSYFIVGNPENNATLRNLVARGLQLDEVRVAGEGFQILTHKIGSAAVDHPLCQNASRPKARLSGVDVLSHDGYPRCRQRGLAAERDNEPCGDLSRLLHAAMLVGLRFARLLAQNIRV